MKKMVRAFTKDVAYSFRMPAGIPGDVNRVWSATIEPQIVTPYGTTGAPTAYGVPLVVDQTSGNVGNMRTVQSTDAAIYGILARAYPLNGTSVTASIGTATPPTSGPIDVLISGYMQVLLSGTTAAYKGAPVYVWVAAATGSHIQGGWEPVASGGNTILIPNSNFTGPADSNGFTEIAFSTR